MKPILQPCKEPFHYKPCLVVMFVTIIWHNRFGIILVWNASVISAAIGVFTKYNLSEIPLGVGRYMIHGVPEIAAYFVTALAGAMFGVGTLRNGFRSKKFLKVLENSIVLLFIAIIFILIAALIEVYITPVLFR